MLKSTEIVVEQLVVGLVFILVVLLFVFGNDITAVASSGGTFQSFVYSVVVVLAAYAVGIFVDRWADTSLQNIEAQLRLKVALRFADRDTLSAWCEMKSLRESIDPLPEDRIRIRILEDGGAAAEYHDYLRTRLRITRAIAFMLPSLFVASAAAATNVGADLRTALGALVALVYFTTVFWVSEQGDEFLPPRTSKVEKISRYVREFYEGEPGNIATDWGRIGKPLFAGLAGNAAICALIVAFRPDNLPENLLYWIMPVALLIVSGLAATTWSRIANTFFLFMSDYNRFRLQSDN